jgi:hypothetical protein
MTRPPGRRLLIGALLFAGLVCVVLLTALLPSSGETAPSDSATGFITFRNGVDIATAVDWMKNHGLTGIELTAHYSDGDENLSTHYEFPPGPPLSNASTAAIAADYGASISDQLQDTYNEESQPDAGATKAELAHIRAVQQRFACGDRRIDEALVTGPSAVLRAARSDPLVASVGIQSD